MKIAIDLTSLFDNLSGIERYTMNISKEMIKQDKKNEYILIFKNEIHKEFLGFAKQKNIKIKIVKGQNKLIFNQIILPKELMKIYADKYLFMAFPSPILFRKKGIINTIHDLTAWDYPETMVRKSRIYFKQSIKNAIKVSEKITTVSQFSKKRIEEVFQRNDIEIIYNGVSKTFEEKKNKRGIKEKYKLPDKYILCLCTLEPRKNIKLLIDAYVELRKENKIDHKLVLAGRKGWKVDNLMENYDQKITEDIFITGFIDDEDLPYVYQNADTFVFPSLYEGFGIPVIEAMYMKVPVIASKTSALQEVVYDCGYLFENNDLYDLKIKIVERMSEEKIVLEEYIDKAYKRANCFKWKKEAEKLISILEGRNG